MGSLRPSPLDPEEFRRQGHILVDFLADYYANVEQYPVRSQVEPGYLRRRLPESAPDHPEPVESILRDVTDHIVPGLTHWQSPNYYAYFPSSGSTAGFVGEMLSTGFNVVGFNWVSSPAATELESIVMDWLGKMLRLPPSFLFSGGGGGVIHGTTCEAILCTLVAARDKVLSRIGRDHIGRLTIYGSDQTHCSLQKAAQIAGLDPANFRPIPTCRSDAFALSPAALRAAIASDVAAGLVPTYLCATVGTTSSAAVDPLADLCAVAQEHDSDNNNMWIHVDAAYAGGACVCPEFRHLIAGVEAANSFSFNAHKWFFTNLDCCCLWVNDPAALVNALSTSPEYLRNGPTESKLVVDYKDWQIALSRRFRALKLWTVIRSHGAANLREFIRAHVRMARLFEGLVGGDRRFELAVPRSFAVVCFRLASTGRPSPDTGLNELNRRLLESINASGSIYMTHAVIGQVYVLRFAVGASLTEERHVRSAWKVVQQHAEALLKQDFSFSNASQ